MLKHLILWNGGSTSFVHQKIEYSYQSVNQRLTENTYQVQQSLPDSIVIFQNCDSSYMLCTGAAARRLFAYANAPAIPAF